MRNILKAGKVIRKTLNILAAVSVICLLGTALILICETTGTEWEYTPVKAQTTAASSSKKKSKLPRYEKGKDGIWKLKNSTSTENTDNNGNIKRSTAVCMFVGDLMCLKGQQYDAGLKQGGYDFYPSYKYVAPIFKSADFVCGNLETLLSESNPITKNQVKAANGQPQCNGPVVYLNALKKAGFDMLVTANNHTCDWGKTGIKETKKHLDEYGFANVGTHYNTENEKKAGERFSIFDVNGIKVAVLSYSHIMNQRSKLSASEMKTMVHLYDKKTVKKDIRAARKKGADFVAVYLHWGIENTESLNSAQLNDSKDVAEAGADLILGSHPHCLQKCTYIKTEDNRKVLCMYSMGNFCSSMARVINNDTIILRVEISKSSGKNVNRVRMKRATYIPCRVMSRDKHSFVVVPTSSALNGNYSSSSLKPASDRIKKIMNGVISEYSGKTGKSDK